MVKCVRSAANVMNKYEVLGVVGEGENNNHVQGHSMSNHPMGLTPPLRCFVTLYFWLLGVVKTKSRIFLALD